MMPSITYSRRKSIESKFTIVSKNKSETNASPNERLQSQKWKNNKEQGVRVMERGQLKHD